MATRLKTLCFLMIFAATWASAHAATVHRSASRSTKHRVLHRRVVWNPVLKGSHDSLLRQNEEIDRLQLPRINDEEQLGELIRTQELVPIEETKALRVSASIKPDKRYCRPWTHQFVADMADAFYNEFHTPLQVNSAVRTAEQQFQLRHHNRNAAPESGDSASSHLAGITVDLAKRGLTAKQHQWVVDYLKNFRDLGLVEVAEERRQACFHVMVSDRYTDWRETNQLADKLVRE